MLEIFHSIIIGSIQGVTEFLPISSSGHLVIIPYIFNWRYQGLSFDVALHFGTVIAIVGYFWRDWIRIIRNALVKSEKLKVKSSGESFNFQLSTFNYPNNLLWQILVATIPAVIIGLLLNNYVEQYFHSPLLIAGNLAFFGLILWLADKYSGVSLKSSVISYKQSFVVGLAQSLALIPGVSRAGITMTASRSLGLNRKEAAHFSFLLATPAIIGAFLLKLKDINQTNLTTASLLAIVMSAMIGFLTIKYLLQYLEKGSFAVFLWYRLAIAVIVMAIYLVR